MSNPVAEAIEVLGGQLEDVAVVCRVTAQAVRNWLIKGKVKDGAYAAQIARATARRGKPVSFEALVGLTGATDGPKGGERISEPTPHEPRLHGLVRTPARSDGPVATARLTSARRRRPGWTSTSSWAA